VVQTNRGAEKVFVLLQLHDTRRRLRWSSSERHWKNERTAWISGLALDLYPCKIVSLQHSFVSNSILGRDPDLCHFVHIFLRDPRFPGRSEVVERGRANLHKEQTIEGSREVSSRSPNYCERCRPRLQGFQDHCRGLYVFRTDRSGKPRPELHRFSLYTPPFYLRRLVDVLDMGPPVYMIVDWGVANWRSFTCHGIFPSFV
jgi:hypothetical protein